MANELKDTFREIGRQLELEAERKEHDSAIARCVTALSVNDAGVIGRATPPLCKLFGWLEDELDGKPVESLLPERFRSTHTTQHLSGFFKRPTSRQMGVGTGAPGTQRTVLAGWNEREQREFPVVIGLEPQHYLNRNWAIGTLAQPLMTDTDWQRLAVELAAKLGIDLSGKQIHEAEILANEVLKA